MQSVPGKWQKVTEVLTLVSAFDLCRYTNHSVLGEKVKFKKPNEKNVQIYEQAIH